MPKEEKYIYGPVPSRRLGLSLGVEVVPYKICTLDCIYCQVGRTIEKTTERKEYIPIESVLAELKRRIDGGLSANYITLSGSGEPTLNSRLGELIDEIKKVTKIPVAILTNGTLLYRPDVRADCGRADVVLPSLDAGDERTFQKISRPHRDISMEKWIGGLIEFRKEYLGQMWLEVFFVEGLNTGDEQIAAIKKAVEKICPDRVQLNTAVRPTAETGIKKADADTLERIAKQLGPKAEVIADFSRVDTFGEDRGRSVESSNKQADACETLLSMLKRRPCSLEDISSGMQKSRNEVLKYIVRLQKEGKVYSSERGGKVYFSAR